MRAEEIRQVQRAQPFRPFTIRLADGREYQIDHPEFMLVSRDNRTVVVDHVEGGIDLLDARLVTSLRVAGARSDDGP